MEKSLKDVLVQLGMSTKEIGIYLAAFMQGPATINEIAKKARIQRSTAYLLVQGLLEKKLLEENLHQYKKKITAVEPTILLRMLEQRKRVIIRQEIALKENLGDLLAMHQSTHVRPRVRVFEGFQGLLAIKQDILGTSKEILLWTNQQAERHIFNRQLHEAFIQQRLKRQIPIRVLTVANAEGKILQASDATTMRMTKLLPANVIFSSEIYIYDDSVAMIDSSSDIIGVITTNEVLTTSQRQLFEMQWSMLP